MVRATSFDIRELSDSPKKKLLAQAVDRKWNVIIEAFLEGDLEYFEKVKKRSRLMMSPLAVDVPKFENNPIERGTRILVGNFGGSNWEIGFYEWNGADWIGDLKEQMLTQSLIDSVRSIDDLNELIADVVWEHVSDGKQYDGVAVSPGFPGKNAVEGRDIDMLITDLSKDFQKGLIGEHSNDGKSVVKLLRKRGVAGTVVAVNDSVSLAFHAQENIGNSRSIPVAFVDGTGMNIVVRLNDKEGRSVYFNTEVGQSTLLGDTEVTRHMVDLKIVPGGVTYDMSEIVEPSGRYLLPQWAAIVNLESEELGLSAGIADRCLKLVRENGNRGSILSELVSGLLDITQLKALLKSEECTAVDLHTLRAVASRVMIDSAINMAILLAPLVSCTADDFSDVTLNCSGGLVESNKAAAVKIAQNGNVIGYKEYLEQVLSFLSHRNVYLREASETKGLACLCASRLEIRNDR